MRAWQWLVGGALLLASRARASGGDAWRAPLAGVNHATSGWGDPRPYRSGTHYGIDLRASVGTPIYAVASGTIAWVDLARTTHGGVALRLELADGASVGYAHLSRVAVTRGQLVTRGQELGATGDTGRGDHAIGTPHLHLTVRMRELALERYVARYGAPTEWISTNSVGQAVPAEPLWAMHYAQRVIDAAAARGVQLHAGAAS